MPSKSWSARRYLKVTIRAADFIRNSSLQWEATHPKILTDFYSLRDATTRLGSGLILRVNLDCEAALDSGKVVPLFSTSRRLPPIAELGYRQPQREPLVIQYSRKGAELAKPVAQSPSLRALCELSVFA